MDFGLQFWGTSNCKISSPFGFRSAVCEVTTTEALVHLDFGLQFRGTSHSKTSSLSELKLLELTFTAKRQVQLDCNFGSVRPKISSASKPQFWELTTAKRPVHLGRSAGEYATAKCPARPNCNAWNYPLQNIQLVLTADLGTNRKHGVVHDSLSCANQILTHKSPVRISARAVLRSMAVLLICNFDRFRHRTTLAVVRSTAALLCCNIDILRQGASRTTHSVCFIS